MKLRLTLALCAVLAMIAILAAAGLAQAGPLARARLDAGAPTVVSYQGQVKVAGSPYTGTGYFKFAVVNGAGDASYWSNDGTSAGGSQPTAAVSLAVSGGLFSVLLGDTSLSGMTQALGAAVFDGADRYLRVWFSSDGSAFQLLSPDRRVAAVPYALQAEEAKEAEDADTVDGQHAAAFWNVAGNAGTSAGANYVGTTDAVSLTLGVSGTARVQIDTAGNVGVGTTTPSERLTVRGDALILGDDNPVAKGSTGTNLDTPKSVFVSGRYAYVSSAYNNRLAIFDVSDPDNIVAKGYTGTDLTEPFSVYVSGRYAYVTSLINSRLVIFDVSDPNNIVAKGYTSTNLNQPYSVYVSGRYAYVASRDNDRLAIFDVSDPDNIVAKGYSSTNLDGPTSVYVSGRYAYVASLNNDRLVIFDVSDPDHIVAKGSSSTSMLGPYSVYVSGRYAYVASQSNDNLTIFDLDNLEAPAVNAGSVKVGNLDVTDNASVGNNLHVQGGLNVGPGGALIGGDAAVQGDLRVTGSYVQFPTINGAAPAAGDCNEASEAGRVVVRTDGTTNLYICTGATGWVGK